MKLKIRREQAAKTGIFGGHKGMKFRLWCQVEISPDEHALIEKYKVENYVLGEYVRFIDGKNSNYYITIGGLIRGEWQEVDNVFTLLNNEDEFKKACENFKNLLMVMATFGGEEIIEI